MKSLKVVRLGLVLASLGFSLIVLLVFHPLRTAAWDDFPLVTLPNTELRSIHSDFTQRDYRLYIALPASYTQSIINYPVLYLLDAQSSFGTVTEYTRRMSFYKELPEVIVVGIGYTTESPDDIIALRARDLTPTDPSGKGQYGWADRFLSFLTDEAIPFVESNYQADTHNRTLVGHSLGGLFGLYTLFTESDVFQGYVVSSPSLWWDERFMFGYEAIFAQQHSHLDARIYMSAGQLETDLAIPIAEEVPEFAAELTKHAYSGLQLSMNLFKDETHASVMPIALVDGIRVVYRSN